MKEKLLEKTERNKQELLHREESMRQQLVELHTVVVHVFRGAGAIDSLSRRSSIASGEQEVHLQNTSSSLLGSSSSICLHLTDLLK